MRDEVPLVDDDDDGAAGLVGVAADVGVERGDAFGGVEDEEGDVGGFEVLAGHDDGELLGHEVGLALAADAGGVDEAEVVAAAGDDFVDGVAGGAGDGGDDGAVGSGEGVEQGGFADVGAADDGDLGLALVEGAVGAEAAGRGRVDRRFVVVGGRLRRLCGGGFGGFSWLGESVARGRRTSGPSSSSSISSSAGEHGCGGLRWSSAWFGEDGEDFVEEVADAGAVLGGDGEDVGEAEAAEVFGLGLQGFGVHLVDGEEDGLAAAEEEAGEFEVGRGELGAAVDDHDDGVGFFERDLGLAEDFGGDEGVVVGDDAAGVDDAGVAAHPLDLAVDAVAGDAGLVADDGAAGAGEAVEEGGLADVGAAADGDQREGGRRFKVAGFRVRGAAGGLHLGGQELGFAPVFFFADVGGVRGLAADDVVGGAGGAGLRWRGLWGDGLAGFVLRGAGGGALLLFELGALGGEDFALARVDCAGGGSDAWGAAFLGPGGCVAVLLA